MESFSLRTPPRSGKRGTPMANLAVQGGIMRKLATLLAALGLIAAPIAALAEEAQSPYGDTSVAVGRTETQRLNRYAFDSVGQRADVYRMCHGGEPSTVEIHRTPGDITLGILTLGWYVPVHVTTGCSPPRSP
jgi:hypothetical protein